MTFPTVQTTVDLCIVGGGMAGTCAAIAAARNGIKVALMQDRPMLGGNASSEIRMWIGGAKGPNSRETGILEEIFLENFYQNPGLRYSVWDTVVFETAKAEPNLTLLMNCSCLDAETEGDTIRSITGWQLTTQSYQRVHAAIFADCSGDSVLAPLSGAEFRYGREGRAEFGESIAPIEADRKTMGMSVMLQYRETDSPKPFRKPSWAYSYPDDSSIPFRGHTVGTNFWWIEIGGEDDCITDTERLRDELIKIAYGIWDHVKNHGDHGMENYELEWVGILPGKRESRRYVGDYIITQKDVEAAGKHFPDVIAYGGWSMDDHFPAGMRHMTSHPTIYHKAPSPWGIPYRAIISKNIRNLMFAGRNISATHTAMSSSRVMATCAVIGQALGTAAALSIHSGKNIHDLDVSTLQQAILQDDLWLPGLTREVSALTLSAKTDTPVLCNGRERGDENLWIGALGETVSYRFGKETKISEIRLVFDSDLNRDYYNMPCYYPLHETKYKVPATLVTEYKIEAVHADGKVETVVEIKENHLRFIRHKVDLTATEIRLTPLATAGSPEAHIFGFELS